MRSPSGVRLTMCLTMWITVSPARIPSPAAASAGQGASSSKTSRLKSKRVLPSKLSKGWNLFSSATVARVAANVPAPCLRMSAPSSTRSSTARLSVPSDTPSSSASTDSVGSLSPGCQSPCRSLSTSTFLTCS